MQPVTSPDIYGTFRNNRDNGSIMPVAAYPWRVPLNYLYILSGQVSPPPELRKVINEESQWSVNYNID